MKEEIADDQNDNVKDKMIVVNIRVRRFLSE